jgi:cytochrome c556
LFQGILTGMRTLSWRNRLVPALAVLCITAACSTSQPAPPPAADAPPYEPAATVKDLMQSIVDPSADLVWNAVTTVQTAKGTIDTVPKTPEDWLKVRHGAVGLSEGANLLMMPGRHVAQPHEKSDTPGVELEPAEMEVLINKDRPAFIQRARALHEAGMAAVAAADAKDPQKLFEVGEQIEQACENCHSHYWYPNEKIPPVPASPR